MALLHAELDEKVACMMYVVSMFLPAHFVGAWGMGHIYGFIPDLYHNGECKLVDCHVRKLVLCLCLLQIRVATCRDVYSRLYVDVHIVSSVSEISASCLLEALYDACFGDEEHCDTTDLFIA